MEQIADDKIMMAIKCCARDGKCNGCNYINKDSCISSLMKDIKDLLAEKDKKIEQLTAEKDSLIKTFGECQAEATKALFENDKEIERLKSYIYAMTVTMHNSAEATRAEAVREFAEKLKDDWWHNAYYSEDVNVRDWIDKLLKEMEGEV